MSGQVNAVMPAILGMTMAAIWIAYKLGILEQINKIDRRGIVLPSLFFLVSPFLFQTIFDTQELDAIKPLLPLLTFMWGAENERRKTIKKEDLLIESLKVELENNFDILASNSRDAMVFLEYIYAGKLDTARNIITTPLDLIQDQCLNLIQANPPVRLLEEGALRNIVSFMKIANQVNREINEKSSSTPDEALEAYCHRILSANTNLFQCLKSLFIQLKIKSDEEAELIFSQQLSKIDTYFYTLVDRAKRDRLS
ncbi:hypothetical protein NDA01_26705 [Trichocoleus desertorum AS-A10]|uniref:hypothetical protein n=1 Tax=Trichocoleus desertorum TaxID=1481672 RepID=UPI0032968F98